MTILGAQLDDLTRLSQRLTMTAGEVGTAREGSILTTTQVVTGVDESARAAATSILGHMDALGISVSATTVEADATMWTGANAERFRESAGHFQQAMDQARQATNETFELFQQTVIGLTEALDDYARQLGVSLVDAETSAQEMANAVEQQRHALDQVMNTGIGGI